MGSLFASVLLAVPPITPLRGIFLLDDPQLGLARFSNAPSGNFPISRKFYSPAAATCPVSHRAAR